jgi:hypothetical protein
MPDRTATSAEVAVTLHLSAATIQLYARSGRIPFDATPGGHRRYDIGEVQQALLGTAADVETELDRSRPLGLGRGVDAPASANAALLRDLRSARPEARPAGAGDGSALDELVAHARRVTLATVSA